MITHHEFVVEFCESSGTFVPPRFSPAFSAIPSSVVRPIEITGSERRGDWLRSAAFAGPGNSTSNNKQIPTSFAWSSCENANFSRMLETVVASQPGGERDEGRMQLLNWIRTLVMAGLALLGSVVPGWAQGAFEERADWKGVFEKHKAAGTLVVADERDKASKRWVYQRERAAKQWIPASTFKIAHALFALDAGVVRDEFQVFPWDGVKRTFPGHNQDQDLRSSMRVSAVWVYEQFAKEIGRERARSYLERAGYGNADPGGQSDIYWLDGKLRISAFEQIEFLRKLYQNRLPFRVEHQRLVKDVMVIEAQREWILRAKTGWTGKQGWWVGWVEWPRGPVFFALHIDTPGRENDLPKREAITREVLRLLDALR